jgi:hypothetical protein
MTRDTTPERMTNDAAEGIISQIKTAAIFEPCLITQNITAVVSRPKGRETLGTKYRDYKFRRFVPDNELLLD